ncbi:hypothetical protein BKA62DRAFT_769532 [Auriculariales sp. MPI-PUGE-AT-0066]|nr:hypothetical protein BKA62DRAFT_769532 [Auriculariales sp. MPI-PUGE-AT-0066]
MAVMLKPTQPELDLAHQIMIMVDPQDQRRLDGDAALQVFAGSNLSNSVLGEIWAIADSRNDGFLDRAGVVVMIRLIGWAQQGEHVSKTLADRVGSIAIIEGFSSESNPTMDESLRNNEPTHRSRPDVPAFVPTAPELELASEIMKFADPRDQRALGGAAALQVFAGANLPNSVLGEIWSIADSLNEGVLNVDAVAVMVRLIGWAQQGEVVSERLLEKVGPMANVAGFSSEGNPSVDESSSNDDPEQPRHLDTPSEFVSTPLELQLAQEIMKVADPEYKRVLLGDIAVEILSGSKLSPAVLGNMWSIVDSHNEGFIGLVALTKVLRLIGWAQGGKEVSKALLSKVSPLAVIEGFSS